MIVSYSDNHPANWIHAYFLVGCLALWVQKYPLSFVKRSLEEANSRGGFASIPRTDDGTLSLFEALEAVDTAVKLGWFDFANFDYRAYDARGSFDRGGISEIVPGEIYAIAGPITPGLVPGAPSMFNTPEQMAEFLRPYNVRAIFRFNERCYDETVFSGQGVKVFDFFFDDGTTPHLALTQKFLQTALSITGAKAFHCRAGLGRTGTMICLLLAEKLHIPVAVITAWLKIVRPGSINERQLRFLRNYERGIKEESPLVHDRQPRSATMPPQPRPPANHLSHSGLQPTPNPFGHHIHIAASASPRHGQTYPSQVSNALPGQTFGQRANLPTRILLGSPVSSQLEQPLWNQWTPPEPRPLALSLFGQRRELDSPRNYNFVNHTAWNRL